MDLSHICKIIGHFMFQQSHSKIMTIIYLINHSTSKLFNQVCLVNIPLVLHMIWCWLFVMLAVSPAHAFYHSDEQPGGPIFQKERCYGAWDKGERTFALYDNLNCPLDKLSQESVICPRSDEFVPADVFLGNIPLRIAIHQPMTMENSLDALVHANLMVKKLIEEREAQQKRARELLVGLSLPFLDSPMSLLEGTRTQQGVGRYERSLGRTSRCPVL